MNIWTHLNFNKSSISYTEVSKVLTDISNIFLTMGGGGNFKFQPISDGLRGCVKESHS